MTDPVLRMANERLAELAIDVKVQLEKGTGTRPVLWLLARARHRAAAAMMAFLEVDPIKEPYKVRDLQNEIRMYDNYISDARDLLVRGIEADRELDEDDREELETIINAVPSNEGYVE